MRNSPLFLLGVGLSVGVLPSLPLAAQDSGPVLVSKTAGGVQWKNVAELEAAAKRGDAQAAAQLGEQLLRGDGVAQDGARALVLLEQAARAGSGLAAFRLAMLQDDGEGVPQDRPRALAYFRAAAAGGVAQAFHNLGAAYGSGRGVKRDYAESLAWMILAKKHIPGNDGEETVRARITRLRHPEWITAGEARAKEIESELEKGSVAGFLPPPAPLKYIGSDAHAGADKSVRVGEVTVVSDAKSSLPTLATSGGSMSAVPTSSAPPVKITTPLGRSLSWPNYEVLEQAAKSGDAKALSALGQVLLAGELVPANPERAIGLLESGASAGSTDAAQQLAVLYTSGGKVPADAAKAFKYNLQAARGGSSQAMYNTGGLLANGMGTPRDFTEGLAWLIVAKQNGRDVGAEQKIRDYLAKSAPDQIPRAEKRAAELQAEIEAAKSKEP